MMFLGPWCLLYRDRHLWQSLDYEVMASPWRDRHAYYEAGKYTYVTYHYLLDRLTDYLNKVHGAHHQKRFWQIIVGPWLLHFTEAFYDRYYCLKEAFKKYQSFNTYLLSESCHVTPQDTMEFIQLTVDDYYNLQLYSQLLDFWGIVSPTKTLVINGKPLQPRSIKSVIKEGLQTASLSLSSKSRLVFWDIYLPRKCFLPYMLASNLSALPVISSNGPKPEYPVKKGEERLGLAHLPAKDEFTSFLAKSLPVNFPTLYLEGYADFLERNLASCGTAPQILMTATGWLFNERLKFLAASWSEKGVKLCGCQHGGLYGTAKWFPPEKHEVEIADCFYTWGWHAPGQDSVKPLANPKISRLAGKRKNRIRPPKDFLFVATSHPRYLYRFFSTPVAEMFEEYLSWRNSFLRALSPDNLRHILIRLLPEDYGRDQKARLADEFPDLRYDNCKIGFLKRLEKTRITIIDHPVTTMLESLSRNIPTILFWDPRYWELRKEARPFFEKLAEAEIWHHNPTSAGQLLNRISRDPGSWWDNPKTQTARTIFVNRFALADRHWAKNWWQEMRSLLKHS